MQAGHSKVLPCTVLHKLLRSKLDFSTSKGFHQCSAMNAGTMTTPWGIKKLGEHYHSPLSSHWLRG